MRCLLEAGLRRDGASQCFERSLMLASQYGHSEVARLLLEAGANKEWWAPEEACWHREGWTVLMQASQYGHLDVACLLLEAGSAKDSIDDACAHLVWVTWRLRARAAESWCSKRLLGR